MVNAALNWASLTGILLLLVALPAAVGACFQMVVLMRRRREPSAGVMLGLVLRLLQLVFRLVSLPVIGAILFFQGWRLDPILQFGVILMAIGYLVEMGSSLLSDVLAWRQRRNDRLGHS